MAEEEQHLRRLAEHPSDELLDDHDRLHAAKYGFVVSIEAAVDIGRHVIASERLRAPDSFAEVFSILGEANLLSPDSAASMADAARFRNVLVHQYIDVDDELVIDILKTRLDDLGRFRREIATALTAADES